MGVLTRALEVNWIIISSSSLQIFVGHLSILVPLILLLEMLTPVNPEASVGQRRLLSKLLVLLVASILNAMGAWVGKEHGVLLVGLASPGWRLGDVIALVLVILRLLLHDDRISLDHPLHFHLGASVKSGGLISATHAFVDSVQVYVVRIVRLVALSRIDVHLVIKRLRQVV